MTTGKFINSRFSCLCAETYYSIGVGEEVYYRFFNKKVYCDKSILFKKEKRNLMEIGVETRVEVKIIKQGVLEL